MVVKALKQFIEKQRQSIKERQNEKNDLENFRQSEELLKAEELKKEADRLAQLKQYSTSIEEYNKALEIFPYKGDEPEIFRNAAEFLFKVNYNIAACYSYLEDFENAITYFDKALSVNSTDDENKVRALMGKGTTHYRKKLLIEGRYKLGAYRIAMDADWEIDDKKLDEYKKEDHKHSFIKQSHDCFAKASNLDKNNSDAWYSKGHMEFLMGKIKDAVQSFDNVLNINKNYENKEGINLFDEIKREKGIPVKTSEILMRESSMEPVFKTKTGHMVRSRAELSIANFLYENSLMFQYNNVATWADKDEFRALFYVPKLDIYIEHFSFDYIKEYQKIMKTKIREYEKHKKKNVYTTSSDEVNIEDALRLKLKPYIVL